MSGTGGAAASPQGPAARPPGALSFAVAALVLSLALLAVLPWQVAWLPGKALPAQPGLWPALALAVMAVAAAGLVAEALARPAAGPEAAEVAVWAAALEYLGWFLGYAALVPWAGYLPATVAVLPALAARVGFRSARMLGLAALTGAAVVLAFKTGLGVRIPGGALYEHLPAGLRSLMIQRF